jgi:hypothetical protein
MKAELLKREDHYGLYNEDGHKIAATIDGCNSKISKENCDEIFGVFDVGALASEECNNTDPLRLDSQKYKQDPYFRIGYLKGYNKAMELNKDKLFGVKEVVELCKILLSNPIEKCGKTYQELTDNYIQSLQQPTEIEVEVEMEKVVDETKMIGVVKGVKGSGNKITTYKSVPKLDSDGCLILKRI